MLIAVFTLVGCVEVGHRERDDSRQDVDSSEFAEVGPMAGMVDAHNDIRRAHGITNDLSWDDHLAQISAEWIEHLDTDRACKMEHNWDSPFGENLFWATYMTTAEEVVQYWASEREFYDYEANDCQDGEMCGHYTQVVWESTENVGCAMMECADDAGFLWMCNYDPPGNWVGEWPY